MTGTGEEVDDTGGAAVEVRRLREELEESRRRELELKGELEALTRLLADDLRTPLQGMGALIDSLAAGAAPGAVGQQVVGSLRERLEGLDRLIGEVLAFGDLRRQELCLQPVSLESAVNTAIMGLSAVIEETGAEVTIRRPLPRVMAEGETLTAAVGRLLSNACKFVSAGVHPQITISAESKGGQVRLLVQDNGIGIAVEDRERIFYPFERLHPEERYPGAGLGLAFVHRAVERMGGTVGVESRPGLGSRFWIQLAR